MADSNTQRLIFYLVRKGNNTMEKLVKESRKASFFVRNSLLRLKELGMVEFKYENGETFYYPILTPLMVRIYDEEEALKRRRDFLNERAEKRIKEEQRRIRRRLNREYV